MQNSSWRVLNLKKVEIRGKRGQAFFSQELQSRLCENSGQGFFLCSFAIRLSRKNDRCDRGGFRLRAQLLPDFFLEASRSAAERTILCPLFSQHPQNQGDEKKSLSAGPLPARF